MLKTVLILTAAVFSLSVFAQPNVKGLEPATTEVTLRFRFTKLEGAKEISLFHFLSSASLGSSSFYKDGTSCETQGALLNLTYQDEKELLGNIVLKQEGHCRRPGQSPEALHEALIAKYQGYFTGVEGLVIERIR